jgi:hypothetical protein
LVFDLQADSQTISKKRRKITACVVRLLIFAQNSDELKKNSPFLGEIEPILALSLFN